MSGPVLDPRSLEDLRRQVARLARAYTPEWRYERAEDDPGAALAELFCTMFHQTVERFDRLPEKLYLEFLDQIGFCEPAPAMARGAMVFDPSGTVADPVSIPAGTQVFAQDGEGGDIVFETRRSIQATPAQLLDVYYTDPAGDQICRLDLDRPQPFFAPAGEALQCHRFELGQAQVLQMDCPGEIELSFLDPAGQPEEGLAKALETLQWSFHCGGAKIPFDAVRGEGGALRLEKRNSLPLEADEAGHLALSCEGTPERTLVLDQALLKSAPLAPCPAQSLFSGDLPIEAEGGYCFGRQPAPYSLFYLRSDTALSKHGARAVLHLDLAAVVVEPDRVGPVIAYDRNIIDKQGAVAPKPDDVFVSHVIWEYFNGSGWRRLEVSGDKDPFSLRQDRAAEIVFEVPEDLRPTEVNAEDGRYLRARVTEVEGQSSQLPRWILPFVRGASFRWQYERGVRPDWALAENNGTRTAVEGADRYPHLQLTLLGPMEPGPRAMYLRFDRSPHAAPLSLRFTAAGGGATEDRPQWSWWNGRRFEPARSFDQTDRLSRSGEIEIFLPEPLPEAEFFGQRGCWLRLSRTSQRPGPVPVVGGIRRNVVAAIERKREPEQYFDTGIYEAGKTIRLLSTPVQDCRVYVGEDLSDGAREALLREEPERLELAQEEEDSTRCWVRWDLIADLTLAGADERVYMLDPYEGTIRFGDGRQGRVPPAGDHNIRVRYSSGGGTRGDLPPGTVCAAMGGLPYIADIFNLTPMSGGTGRMRLEEIEARGDRILRTRGRAAGRRDYEDLVLQAFPQVRHVRCFSGLDEQGRRAPGHVTVALSGFGPPEEAAELCAQVWDYLSGRVSCCLIGEGRLHIRPATLLTVNTQATVVVERPELAAGTQQEIVQRLSALIERRWKGRPIGDQIRLDEVWQTVRQIPNVRLAEQILVEAACREDGVDRLYPLERDGDFPFGVVENGIHRVRLR